MLRNDQVGKNKCYSLGLAIDRLARSPHYTKDLYKRIDNFCKRNGNYIDDSYALYKHDDEYYLLLSSAYGLQGISNKFDVILRPTWNAFCQL